jgi:ubiquitin C-terminal hydrolase
MGSVGGEFASETLSSDINSEKSLRNITYKLYGVLVHLGYTSHSGHYYSYVRGPNDVWYKADDQRVSFIRTKIFFILNHGLIF